MPNKPPLGLNDKIGFGRYKDSTVIECIELDPPYILWMRSERITNERAAGTTVKNGGFKAEVHDVLNALIDSDKKLARKFSKFRCDQAEPPDWRIISVDESGKFFEKTNSVEVEPEEPKKVRENWGDW